MSEPELLPDVTKMGNDHIHVWHVSLAQLASARFPVELLTASEQQRAAGYRFDADRQCFAWGRSLARILIGRYMGCEAGRVQFSFGRFGKPMLVQEDDYAGNSLYFNLSHSGSYLSLGFSRTMPLGIDIEKVRPISNIATLAARVLAAGELEYVMSLPAEARDRGFLRCWTLKEASLKLSGAGLSAEPKEVLVDPWKEESLIRSDGWHGLETRWMRVLTPASGYIGAVAAAASPEEVLEVCWP
ncbi:MAG TPA: 4'-phosphopantetheinyl transferase superfamily protein [Pirellulales bacterium]